MLTKKLVFICSPWPGVKLASKNQETRLKHQHHLASMPNFGLLGRVKTVGAKEWGIFVDQLTDRATYRADSGAKSKPLTSTAVYSVWVTHLD